MPLTPMNSGFVEYQALLEFAVVSLAVAVVRDYVAAGSLAALEVYFESAAVSAVVAAGCSFAVVVAGAPAAA